MLKKILLAVGGLLLPVNEGRKAKGERRKAKVDAEKLGLSPFAFRLSPFSVDGMDNRAEKLYAAWPERIYIIDSSGKIVYKGKPGPFGYKPEEVESWLKAHDTMRGHAA